MGGCIGVGWAWHREGDGVYLVGRGTQCGVEVGLWV